ncbi:pilus assembly protein [Arthrobacter psychrolactophilus]|uniref:Pilus assembly protein n=1 Tax=Arthrobacter psychrolactophilus TaxID=92442 RepID=A0A2V5JG89_9MICC|nr:RcpC/CpaB family pilus assembly protein [Arthrobacter psychrolactophilus]PYI38757.1 pilus assembly protein [Arthrobacter psychrolactophilus]
MKTRLLGGVVALVLAIVGAVLLSSYVKASDARAQAGLNPVDVLVVQENIPSGTPIEDFKTSVKAQSLPRTAVSDTTVTNLKDYAGKVAAVDLVPGEQLQASRLVDPKSLAAPNRVDVPKGLAEVSLTLAPERVIGGDLKAGDTVGVFISYNAGVVPGTTEVPATKLQFHKVLVTKVGTGDGNSASDANQSSESSKPGAFVMVTLAQSGMDATKTVHAIEFGHIYLSKENADTDTLSVDTLHKDQVLK